MRFRILLVLAFLFHSVGTADAAPAPVRRVPFWASSDGKGTVSLFWLPPDGRWPAGGFRLERVSRGKTAVVAARTGPAEDADAMARLDPADAAEIRRLAEKIRTESLSDDERNRSITVTGRNAVVDMGFGRALGVRRTDTPRGPGRVKYRLKGLSANGTPEMVLESNEVDPAKRTPPPRQPQALHAEARRDGVGLTWKDPVSDGTAPIVAYHVAREGPGRKVLPLTQAPLVLNRHLRRGEPDFHDADAPRRTMTYRVQSVDVFGRRSAPVQAKVVETDFPAPDLAAPRTVETAPAAEAAPTVPLAVSLPPEPPAPRPPPAPLPAADKLRVVASAADSPPAAPSAEPSSARTLARMEAISHPPSAVEAAAGTAARAEPASQPEPGYFSGGRIPARMETILHPASPPSSRGPEPAPPPPPPSAVEAAAAATPSSPGRAEMPASPSSGKSVARMETILHPPSGENAPKPEPAPPAAADAIKAAPPNGVPTPVIVGIQGANGRVIIEFRASDPGKNGIQVIVLRSEYPMTAGLPVGRPVPREARLWEDTSVEPGQNFWYRLVAVDKDGNRSLPTPPRWIRVGPR